MGQCIDLYKKSSVGLGIAQRLTASTDKKDDPIIYNAIQKHLDRRSVFDPLYGKLPEDIKEINLPTNYELDKDIDQGTMAGATMGALLGTLPSALSGNIYATPIIAGAALGGYGINRATINAQKNYRNLSDKEKRIALKESLKSYKEQEEKGNLTSADLQQAQGFNAVGSLAGALANPVAAEAMIRSVGGLEALKEKELAQIINSAGLKNKLDVKKPNTSAGQFNAYFKPYSDAQAKATGKIGLIEALSKKTWKPGIMAHEVGHADIHNTSSIDPVGFMQRRMYKPTMMMNQFGLGILPVVATNKLVGKEEDNPLVGGLKGGLVGSAANAGVLVPEFEASRRGLKHMMNSPSLKGKVLPNAISTLPAFLTYLTFLAGPSAAAGAIKAYLNKKRKENEKSAADEDEGLSNNSKALMAGGALGALPMAAYIGKKPIIHTGENEMHTDLNALKKKIRAGDIILSGSPNTSLAKVMINLSQGMPESYHAGVAAKNKSLSVVDSHPFHGIGESDYLGAHENIHVLRHKDTKHNANLSRKVKEVSKNSEKFRNIIEKRLASGGLHPDDAHRFSWYAMRRLYSNDEGVISGVKDIFLPNLANSTASVKNVGNTYKDFNKNHKNYGKQVGDKILELLENDPNYINKDPGLKVLNKLVPQVKSTCSTLPAVLGGKNIVAGKHVKDTLPADFLKSKDYVSIGKYKTAPSNSMIDRAAHSSLKYAPHALRLGAGATLGGLGYMAAKKYLNKED
jgi:hypothetical protein